MIVTVVSLKSDFRYYLTLPSSAWHPWPDVRRLSNTIIQSISLTPSQYQLGKTKIFFRAGCLSQLDITRSQVATRLISLIRRNMVRYRARKYFLECRTAVVKIQRWWRAVLARREILKLRGEVEMLKRRKAERAAALAQQREQRDLKASINGTGTRTSPTRTFSVTLSLS